MWVDGGRCGPLSRANRRPRGDEKRETDISDTLAEMHAMLEYVRRGRPRIAVLETVGDMMTARLQRERESWLAIMQSVEGYEWQVMRIQPERHLGTRQARDRAWAVGVKKSAIRKSTRMARERGRGRAAGRGR